MQGGTTGTEDEAGLSPAPAPCAPLPLPNGPDAPQVEVISSARAASGSGAGREAMQGDVGDGHAPLAPTPSGVGEGGAAPPAGMPMQERGRGSPGPADTAGSAQPYGPARPVDATPPPGRPRMAVARGLRALVGGRFLRALGGAGLMAAAARGAQFAMAVALGAQLGPAGFGQAAFAIGAGALAGQLGAGGWPALAVRRLGRLVESPSRMTQLLDLSARAVCRGGLLAAAALGAVAGLAALALGGETGRGLDLAEGLALAALVAPGAALRRLARQQLGALFRPAAALAIEELAAPLATLLVCLLPGVGAWVGGGAGPAVTVFALAGLVAGAAGLSLARRAALQGRPPSPAAADAADASLWRDEARALLPTLAPRLLLARADMLLIAPLLGFEAAGFYAAAQRLAFLVSAPPLLLAQVIQPWASRALHLGDRRGLRRALGAGLAGTLAWAGPATLVALAFPGTLAALFGADFAASAGLLAALALGEAAAALTATLVVAAISGPWMRGLGRAGLALAAAQAAAIALVAPDWGGGLGAAGAAWISCATALALALVTAAAARAAVASTGPATTCALRAGARGR